MFGTNRTLRGIANSRTILPSSQGMPFSTISNMKGYFLRSVVVNVVQQDARWPTRTPTRIYRERERERERDREHRNKHQAYEKSQHAVKILDA